MHCMVTISLYTQRSLVINIFSVYDVLLGAYSYSHPYPYPSSNLHIGTSMVFYDHMVLGYAGMEMHCKRITNLVVNLFFCLSENSSPTDTPLF